MSRIASFGEVRQREPRVRDNVHLGKVAQLPCLACLIKDGRARRPVQVAHVRVGYPGVVGWREVGKSEKPSDFRTVPLCVGHHLDWPDAQHRHNERDWHEDLGVYPPDLCLALVQAFARGETGDRVLLEFASIARKVRRP